MGARHRNALLVAFSVVVAAVVATSVAWACTAQVGIAPVTPLGGPPGTKVAVKGTSTLPGPVEIRWNGVKGSLLATALADQGEHRSDFSAEVTVPPAPPGVYSLLVVPAGSTAGVGRAAFRVLPSTQGAAAAPEGPATNGPASWSAFGEGTGVSPSPVDSTPAFVAGIALLGAGLVAMVAGFGVASMRRRSRVGIARGHQRSPAE